VVAGLASRADYVVQLGETRRVAGRWIADRFVLKTKIAWKIRPPVCHSRECSSRGHHAQSVARTILTLLIPGGMWTS
jgi:hypothetical protein